MKRNFWMTLLGLFLVISGTARAFPPAPHHLIYGIVRDQYGTPLLNSQAKIVLQSSNGVRIVTTVAPGLAVGINFAMEVPMDWAISPDIYKSNALVTDTPFKLYVVIGTVTNVPIQSTHGFTLLGTPAKQTRLDLTLGTDSSGDGIPDAWKRAFLATLGLDLDIAALKSNVDYAHDGRTLMQEFLLGNYPFNPIDSFSVRLVDPNPASPVLEFTTMIGRSYTVLGSDDLANWTTLSFQFSGGSGTPVPRASFYAEDIQTVRVQVLQPTNSPVLRFFKLQLQ